MELGTKPDELSDLMAMTDAKMLDMVQSGAMRSDPYRLALGVLVPVVQLLSSTARHLRWPGEMSQADQDACRAAMVRAAGQEGKVLGRQLHRRTAIGVGLAVSGSFVAGVALTAAVGYASGLAGASGPAVLPGDAMLCQASGVRQDAEGRKFYPALSVRLEVSGRR